MSRELELGCRCGRVRGRLREASADTVNRLVCYCDDCQAFLRHLDREDLLDAAGGSDIVQVAPQRLSYDRGLEELACVRLGPKGLFRWHARCCATPLGNTHSASIPFVGLAREIFGETTLDDVVGPPRARVLTRFATGAPPSRAEDAGARFFARTARLILGWKLRRRSWPHPFFDRDGASVRAARVLTPAEREALRPLR